MARNWLGHKKVKEYSPGKYSDLLLDEIYKKRNKNVSQEFVGLLGICMVITNLYGY